METDSTTLTPTFMLFSFLHLSLTSFAQIDL